MGLTIHRRISTQARVITTLVALFALVAQPMYGLVAGQVANAVEVAATVVATNGSTEYDNIQTAINKAKPSDVIKLESDITLGDTAIKINKSIILDGNGRTITAPSVRAESGDNKNAAVVISASDVTVKNLTINSTNANPMHGVVVHGQTGLISGILLQGLTVTGGTINVQLSKDADVTINSITTGGSKWGGIAVGANSTLTMTGTNSHSDAVQLYIDSVNTATVDTNGLYYISADKGAGNIEYKLGKSVATNVDTDVSYTSVQAAIVAATSRDVIRLDQNIVLGDTAIKVNKSIILDGNNKTITAPEVRGSTGDNKNAAIVIGASDVVVKNLTINSTNTNPMHGIVVHGQTGLISDISLQDLTVTGGTINVQLSRNANVVIDSITTSGSNWGSIAVGANSTVTMTGANSHSDKVHLYIDKDVANATVNTNNLYYISADNGNGNLEYRLIEVPTVKSVTPGAGGYLSGKGKVYINVANPDAMRGGFLMLNKAVTQGSPSNANKINYKLQQDDDGKWYAAVDAAELTNGAKYLFKVEAHGVSDPWGYYGNNSAWIYPSYYFIVDNTNPTITVKPAPDTVGSFGDNIFSKVSFKLHDNYKFEGKYTINGVASSVGENDWGDANGITVGQRGAVYGKNTITLKDLAGHSASYDFMLDNKSPTVTMKDSPATIGSGPYSKVSFGLYDDYKITKAEVNGNVVPLSPDKWSDLNEIKVGSMGGQHGDNTVKVYDLAGNVTTVNFVLDNVAPTATFTHSNNNDKNLVNTEVMSMLNASEPIQTPAGWTPVDTEGKVFTKNSTSNNKGDVIIIDLAGNKGSVFFEVKRIDKIKPTFNITNGDVFNTSSVEIVVTEDNFGDTVNVDGYEVAHSNTKPNYRVAVSGEGDHTIIATDKAGNVSTVMFTIDSTAPILTINNPIINADGTYRLTGTTTDINAPVSIVKNNSNIGAANIGTELAPGGVWGWAINVGSLTAGQRYVFIATSADSVNNTAMRTTTYDVPTVDTTDGQINLLITGPDSLAPSPTTLFANGFNTVGAASFVADPAEVLGAQDTKGVDTGILGASKDIAAIAPSAQGWKIFGLAWYWLLLAIAAVAGIWWWIAAVRRRSQEA